MYREILEDDECECGCHDEECHCESECHCKEGCSCSDECDCGDDCHCHEGDKCNKECDCENAQVCEGEHVCCEHGEEYLELAKRVQADFENFRRHAIEDIKKAKIDGQVSVIEAFLPCLDIFKEAKKSITDENVLKGVEMVENKIIDSLENLGVKKLESIGQIYDPRVHNVIAVVRNDQLENDIIVEEYQAGYEFNGKIIRDAKVIVNKKED